MRAMNLGADGGSPVAVWCDDLDDGIARLDHIPDVYHVPDDSRRVGRRVIGPFDRERYRRIGAIRVRLLVHLVEHTEFAHHVVETGDGAFPVSFLNDSVATEFRGERRYACNVQYRASERTVELVYLVVPHLQLAYGRKSEGLGEALYRRCQPIASESLRNSP